MKSERLVDSLKKRREILRGTSLKTSFFDTCPKVWVDKNHLYARTSNFYRFFNLFFYSRTVVVDQIKRHIEIEIKTFWFFSSKKHIAFKDIKYIDMERREKGGMFGLTHTQGFTETWHVQIIKKNSPQPEKLFRFIGDGGGDGTAIMPHDITGMQYEKAIRYAELVSKYTGSQLFKDISILKNFKKVDHYKCLKCGHENTSEIKCVYCGSQEMEK